LFATLLWSLRVTEPRSTKMPPLVFDAIVLSSFRITAPLPPSTPPPDGATLSVMLP